MSYEMRGQFLEACDCSVPCPCWFVEQPDEDECTGVVAWQIEQGTIEGIDVSGLGVASVSQHEGSRGATGSHAKMRVALFVDERATQGQAEAMALAFSGGLGGPLGELAEMTSRTPDIERAPIAFVSDGAHTRLEIGSGVHAAMTPVVGATGRITTIADSIMANLLGSLGEVGRTATLTLNLPRHGLELAVQDRSATRGRFAYVHR
jgi:hypothetical protein